MNRRTFVSSLAVAGAAAAVRPARVFGAESAPTTKVGLIGCGWFGGVVLTSMLKRTPVEFVSLCDPNQHALQETLALTAKLQHGTPRTFADYREMLASTKHDIVVVSTPDHWHALPAIAAMQAGADVLLEKPVSIDVLEGEALVAAARKYQRTVQVNTQRRSTRCLAEARDKYVRSGRLGTIGLVEAFSYLPGRPNQPMPDAPVPSYLDYERWVGPAPMLPFKEPFASKGWRAFREFGSGQIGDLGVHMIDCVRWMLDLGWPQSISSTGGIYVDRVTPANITDTQRAVFHYPNLDVSWEHRTWGTPPMKPRHWTDLWGARIIGTKGTLAFTILGYEFTPADGGPRECVHMLSKTGDQQNLDESRFEAAYDAIQDWHVLDFMRARETRSRPVADIEQGHISTACCVLANLAMDLGRPLRYDPATRTVVGDADATGKLARGYRGPWIHPDLTSV